jgi:hypothetical protein
VDKETTEVLPAEFPVPKNEQKKSCRHDEVSCIPGFLEEKEPSLDGSLRFHRDKAETYVSVLI